MAVVLISGAAGFVGNNLARHLIHCGHRVNLILRENHAEWRLGDLFEHVIIHTGDLCDQDRVKHVVRSIRPERIYHLAAHGQYSYQMDLMRILQTNIMGTANLVEACAEIGFEAFINTGSSSEYGLKSYPPRENEYLEPNSYYSVAKASATLFCRYTARKRGLRIPTLRLYSAYGPYEEPSRLIPQLIMHGFRKKFPPLVDPNIARDFIYIDDIISAYDLVADIPTDDLGAVYNVGTGVQTTLGEVVKAVQSVLDVEQEPQWGTMPNRMWDTDVWVADTTSIREVIGWKPRYSFSEGFARMVDWFRSAPDMIETYSKMSETHLS